MRARATFLVLTVAFLLACGCSSNSNDNPGGDATADNTSVDVETDTSVPNLEFGLVPPPLTRQAFTVTVSADTNIGAVGQTFQVTAKVARGEATGEPTFTWDFDGAEGTAIAMNGSTQQVAFQTPGQYAAEVTATDEDGNQAKAGVLLVVHEAGGAFRVGDVDGDGEVTQTDVDEAIAHIDGTATLTPDEFARADVDLNRKLERLDVELIQSAVDDGTDAPTALWPQAGSLGTKIRIIHPALLDVAAPALLQFGDSDPLSPMRGAPGQATSVVPPDQDSAGLVELKLLVSGEPVQTWDFEILPLPKASDEPGEKLLDAFDLLEDQLQVLPILVDQYLDVLGSSEKNKAAVLGMLEVSIQSFMTHKVAFLEAFQEMEPEGRAAYEQIALANGLDDVLSDLQAVKLDLEGGGFLDGAENMITVGQAATVITLLCGAQDIADISDKVAEINEIASGYLDWFDWWPFNKIPVVGQVITFLSTLSNAIGAITDIIGMVAEFLPEFQELEIEVTPASVLVGGSVTATPTIGVNLGSNLCSQLANSLISDMVSEMTDRLSRRLGSMIPLASDAFRSARYNRDRMGEIVGLVYDAVSGIAGAIVDALGIQERLEGLAEDVCKLIEDASLPLSLDILGASCGTVNGGTWICTEDCMKPVTISGEQEICGEPKSGSSAVTCEGCNSDNCQGCCENLSCVPTADQDHTQCGSNGASCQQCESEEFACEGGQCVCHETCDTEGDLTCQGNAVFVCQNVAVGVQCLKWRHQEDCINGAVCESGVCEGGCHVGNCAGCCTSQGDCLAGTTNEACGINGDTCLYCVFPDACINAVCECQPQCQGRECGSDSCEGECGQCAAGAVCDPDGHCVDTCGNGNIDAGEDCENDGQCNEGETCDACKCKEPGGGGPCDPGEALLEGGQAHVTVDTGDCTCGSGSGYSQTSVLVLDYMPGAGIIGGSTEPPWLFTGSDPEGLTQDGWMLNAFPLGVPVTVFMNNPDTGENIAITFTMLEDGIADVSVECL